MKSDLKEKISWGSVNVMMFLGDTALSKVSVFLENGFVESLPWLDFYDQSVSIHILFLTLDLYRLLIHNSFNYFISIKVAYL